MDLNPIQNHLHLIPEVLYKYRSLDNSGYSLNMAGRGEVFFASADSLNDPFEFWYSPTGPYFELEGQKLEQHVRERAARLFGKSEPELSEEEIQHFLKRIRSAKSGNSDAIRDLYKIQYEAVGVLSLAATFKSLPMWSYYANNHEGICIGLRTKSLAKLQQEKLEEKEVVIFGEVEYTEEMPKVKLGCDLDCDLDTVDIERQFFCKSSEWRHEKEYRLLLWDHVRHTQTLGSDSVAEIYIGARAKAISVRCLLAELKFCGSRAKVYKSLLSINEYKLDFERVR